VIPVTYRRILTDISRAQVWLAIVQPPVLAIVVVLLAVFAIVGRRPLELVV
jgi:hypothetical protein